jgi:hypothetical protein
MRPGGLAARQLRQGEEPEANRGIARSRAEQVAELLLGRLQGAVRHVVDEADDDRVAVPAGTRHS